MAISPFDRPIPGQSLTDEPRNNPWENPPEMSAIEDVTKYYIEKLANQDVIDDFAVLLQTGIPLKPLVESVTTIGVMKGLHTVDASMLVGPIIHQFIKQAVEAQGISVKDDGRDYQKEAEERELRRFKMVAAKYLGQDPNMEDPGKQVLSEIVEGGEPEEEVTPEEQPQGLMAKG